jgi:SNF2 family DNA or RNA helicase
VHQGALRSRNPYALAAADIVITTYTTIRNDLPLLREVNFAHLILDEAQAIKNDKTQIAQAVYKLKADFRLSMTGTPIENRFSELWSQFRFLIPDLFEGIEKFEADAAMDSRKIKRKVRPFILRRDKREVAKELPEKIEQVVWVEMGESQRALYEEFLAKVKGSKQKKSTIEILEAILRLRQLCCHPLLLSQHFDDDASMESAKFTALFADLETLFAERQKVLVYSQFTSMLSLMIKEAHARGWKFSVLDGSTKDREAQVQRFQEDPEIPLFFISLKAGGAGLNLTAADAVLLYDPWWNEAVERQAIDRAHRMGRSSPVLAKRYVVQESVEEKMMKIKQAKNILANDIFEEDLASLRLTAEELEQLLL